MYWPGSTAQGAVAALVSSIVLGPALTTYAVLILQEQAATGSGTY